MKLYQIQLCGLILLGGITFVSCSKSDSNDEDFTPHTFNVIGKVEKGPFISGSTITIQPMDSKLQVIGSMFNTTITDNVGNFSFGAKEFQAPYAEMMATGYFFNEVKGSLSTGTLVLRSLVDLSDNSTVNVNILTHLKYPRIKKLIESGKSFKEANTQAQTELLSAFGLQKYSSKDASQFSIVAGTDESAALIAVSSLLLMNRTEGQLTEYLSTLSQEFGNNGKFSDSTIAQLKRDKLELADDLSNISNNIINRYTELGINVEVKDLAAYFDWDDDGTAGNETLKDDQKVTIDKSEISVPKSGGTYTINITSPIPVYVKPIIQGPADDIISNPLMELYDGESSPTPSIEKSIESNVLKIIVGKATSRYEQTLAVNIYDCLGNIVNTATLNIEGDKQAKVPLLGSTAKDVMTNTAKSLTSAYGLFNVVEQMYYYNKDIKQIPLSASDNRISDIWSKIFSANSTLLLLKNADEQQKNLYQEYCDVFYSMYYYTLITGWGDVPYNYGQPWGMEFSIPRVAKSTIFTDLKTRLNSAIDVLEEKKNTSTTDINGLFFVSKDVARIVLANIYMYEGEWASARTLLSKVRSNGYYQLEATDENDLNNKGLIFGFDGTTYGTSRSRSITIKQPLIIPVQSLTEVYLLNAECEYHLGNETSAKSLLAEVTSVKGISVSSNVLTGIKEARAKCLLYDSNYFAFLKRNNLAISECGILDYQKLFPIPSQELMTNSYMIQNPGY